MKIDKTEKLFSWLDENAEERKISNCYGEGFTMYTVPLEKSKGFYDVYLPALISEEGKWDEWECAGCVKGDVIIGVMGSEWHNDETKFTYHLRGSDYDTGMYEAGPNGGVECKGWLRFYDDRRLVEYWDCILRQDNLSIERGNSSENIVVFI